MTSNEESEAENWREAFNNMTAVALEQHDIILGLYEQAPPLDDLESVITRYTFQVERGKDEALDRVMAWLDRVKPVTP